MFVILLLTSLVLSLIALFIFLWGYSRLENTTLPEVLRDWRDELEYADSEDFAFGAMCVFLFLICGSFLGPLAFIISLGYAGFAWYINRLRNK